MTEKGLEGEGSIPTVALQAILHDTAQVTENMLPVTGILYDNTLHIDKMLEQFKTFGFQATNLGLAADMIDKMLSWRLSDDPITEDEIGTIFEDPEVRKKTKCTIWVAFTSNMISCGLREAFVYLAKNKLVDVFVTSAGGVEEDLIKCMGDTYIGKFTLDGAELREKGWNRIGNLLLPNENYCAFEDWLQPILDDMHEQQVKQGKIWTPMTFIDYMGSKINDETSLYYWTHKHNIPVFCPGLTDGSIGDNLYFHTYRKDTPTTLYLDIVKDVRDICDLSIRCKKSGIIILGGGLPKHHVCNSNLMRNGADFAVYVSTAQEFDGSDSGANPDEAISWGKIKANTDPVKVHADASIVFPLLVAGVFTKHINRQNE